MVLFGLFHQHLAHLCLVAHFQFSNRFKRGSTVRTFVEMSDFAQFLRKTYQDQSDNDSQQNQFVVIPVLYFGFASCHKFLIFTRSLRTRVGNALVLMALVSASVPWALKFSAPKSQCWHWKLALVLQKFWKGTGQWFSVLSVPNGDFLDKIANFSKN